MFRILLLVAFVGAVYGQNYRGDPQTAAILNEQRYLSGDGKFGAQYSQEDGVEFKEESDADGTRRGSYSYVDPTGQRRTVSYTAGKNGFQASGDGIPQPAPTVLPVAPRPQYQPLPQYNPPQNQNQYNRPQPQPQYEPQYQPQQQYQPQPQYQPQQQYQPQPQPQQYRPQPQPQQYQQQPQYNPQYEPTTPPPHRFYPPGKLSLNRSPDGFSYSFQKS